MTNVTCIDLKRKLKEAAGLIQACRQVIGNSAPDLTCLLSSAAMATTNAIVRIDSKLVRR